ncbi:MAG: GNAT family N-acetyltransferase [Clostridia bacterium]|nr:GNAT family N-acetyltransferase [Clostridia bacterium]
MSSAPVFRRLVQGDEAEARAFYADMGERSSGFFNVDKGNEKRTLEFFEGKRPDHVFYGMFEDGSLLALAFIWDVGRSVVWFGVAVRDGFQGRGLGKQITNGVLDECRADGHGGVLLRTHRDNIPAQKLYEACGFEHIGTHPSGELLYIYRFFR